MPLKKHYFDRKRTLSKKTKEKLPTVATLQQCNFIIRRKKKRHCKNYKKKKQEKKKAKNGTSASTAKFMRKIEQKINSSLFDAAVESVKNVLVLTNSQRHFLFVSDWT